MALSIYNLLSLLILSKGKLDKGRLTSLLTDFANMMRCDSGLIASADVPSAMKEMAKLIANREQFSRFTVGEAREWLENDHEKPGLMFRKFMDDHGHRGFREFDIMAKTWREEPDLLVQRLQVLAMSANIDQSRVKSKELKLQTPLGPVSRLALKRWLMPCTHKLLANREEAKSFLIFIVDKFRVFVRQLADVMTFREGRLPEPDLIYFLTLAELISLSETRDPKLVIKAQRMKKLHAIINGNHYDEIIVGPEMKPNNLSERNDAKKRFLADKMLVIKGTPVSTGNVTARVCVVKTYDEANQIQCGDIMVTYSTDIGWSPYFPLLGGLITEIGGLVSHGAIIAREYGLPCLVGVEHATQLLTSGDTVMLDAYKGEIVVITVSN